MIAVEEVDLSPAAVAAARLARASGVVARCVRLECAALLREADAAASGEHGATFDVLLIGAVLAALGGYVKHDVDPVARLMASGGGDRRRSAERIAARVAVETERERLGEARRAAKEIHEAARESGGPGVYEAAQDSWEAYGKADRAFREFNAAHPEGA
jgi:hypothetical protein